jgi:hypothetical protein
MIRSVSWLINGNEFTAPFPIILKPNGTQHVEVIVQTDGERRLDEGSLKWSQSVVRPANPLLAVPPLRISPQPAKNAGSAWQLPAIIQAPPTTGAYPDLEFEVSAQLLLQPGSTLHCTVIVNPPKASGH